MKFRLLALALSGVLFLSGCGGGSSLSGNQTPPVTPATISSISPTSVQAGSGATALDVTGTNFVSNSVVTFNGTSLTTTFVSATSLRATIPAARLTAGENAQIAVVNLGAAASASLAFQVNSPVPTLNSANPAAVAMGSITVMTLTGTGFESNSSVQFNGAPISSIFVDSSTLAAQFTSGALTQAGTGQVTVVNPPPAGGTSAALTLQVTQPIPVTPASILAGSGAVPVTINGSNFTSEATITANGTPLTITAQTGTSITTTLSSAAVAQTGTVALIVTNPGFNQESSDAANLPVVTTPGVGGVNPRGAALGSPDQTITVWGSGFAPISVIQWNGKALKTTYHNSGSLQAMIPAIQFANFNNALISVSTPVGFPMDPGFVASGSVPFSTYLEIPNNDIAYNAVDGLLYASVPGSAPGGLGNCIVGIDPTDGNIVKKIPVGSEPGLIAISDDGTQLYAGLNGARAVRQVNLVTGTAGIQIPLGPATVVGTPTTVEAIAQVPAEPNSVAVFDNNATVTIYDSGVARAKSSFGITDGYVDQSRGSMSFGASASTLYVSSYLGGIYSLSVDATGIASGKLLSMSAGGGFGIQYDNDRLYLSNGTVLDAATANQLGLFSTAPSQTATGPVVSDSTLGLAFIANNSFSAGPELAAFNESTFNPTGTIPLSYGGFTKIVRWGQDGLATSNSTQIYVVQSPMVKDLSGSPADLAVTVTSPASAVTGSSITWTAKVMNNGPNQAQGVALNASIADNVIVQSVTSTQGTCAGGNRVSCNLGPVKSGANVTVMVVAIPSTSGTVQSTAVVSSTSFDPVQTNNQATASTAVSGSLYSAIPVVTAISPALVQAGSGSFTLTLSGSGFNSASVVQINGQAQATTLVDGSTLTANVDAAAIAKYGWAPVIVANPSPGGGVSQAVPLTIYALVDAPANAIAFDPFTQKIYATLPSSSSTYTGNSIVSIDPVTATVGTPVAVGSEPNVMAETTDGNTLWVGISGANSLGQFNLRKQTLDATIPMSLPQFGYSGVAAGSMAAVPGSDSALAISTAKSGHMGIFDATGNTGTFRPNMTGGSNMVFLDASHLDVAGGGLYEYSVDSNGLTGIGNTGLGYSVSGFNGLGPQNVSLDGGILYGVGGGIVDPYANPPAMVAVLNTSDLFGLAVAPDAATAKDFLVLENAAGSFWYHLVRYNTTQYVEEAELVLPNAQDGGELGYDILRWGQDGLALRAYGTFGGSATPQVLLIRGPFVLPSEMTSNSAPQLTGASQTTITVDRGNTVLSLNGSGFMPGAVALWNGTPRTTKYVSATALSMDIAVADVAATGSGTITVQNPNSAASAAITIMVK